MEGARVQTVAFTKGGARQAADPPGADRLQPSWMAADRRWGLARSMPLRLLVRSRGWRRNLCRWRAGRGGDADVVLVTEHLAGRRRGPGLSGASGRLVEIPRAAAYPGILPIRGSAAMTLHARAISEEEREMLGRMARSRTVGAGLVRRAQIIMHALEGLKAPDISARMDLCGATVRHWLKRFNARGLPGLEEDVRSGRPPTYSAEQRSAVINTALTRPADLGLPFASWTLDRLVAYLSGQGIAMRRSRISEIVIQEGLKWRQEETWFGARVDPDFARKRGRSSDSTRRRRPAASSSASTRWDRRPARATRASGW
jgi:transposase